MANYEMTVEQIAVEQASFISKVYAWMCAALVLTGLVAMWAASSEWVLSLILGNRMVFLGLIIVEILCVGVLVSVIQRISSQVAILIFMSYAVMNGITLSAIFISFTSESIATTFYITAGTFGLMSAYGYFTKSDLTTLGNLAFMALIGLINATVVNIFLRNEMLYWITSYAGILIFVALTAYDTQKIKAMNIIGNEGTEEDRKEAIMGALTPYLDFINLFLYLLRIFGRRK